MKPSKLEMVDLSVPPVGEWVTWNRKEAARNPELREAVARFESLDSDMGARAANFLRDHALENDGSTRTYLMVVEGEVEGFFACCNGSVALSRAQASALEVPYRRTLPAFIIAWIARRRGGTVGGEHLMLKAIGVAREQREHVGSVAVALDPGDEILARLWIDDYGFQPCEPDKDDGLNRLWLRID